MQMEGLKHNVSVHIDICMCTLMGSLFLLSAHTHTHTHIQSSTYTGEQDKNTVLTSQLIRCEGAEQNNPLQGWSSKTFFMCVRVCVGVCESIKH